MKFKKLVLCCCAMALLIGCAAETELPVHRPEGTQPVAAMDPATAEPVSEPEEPFETDPADVLPEPTDALPEPIEAPKRQDSTAGVLEQIRAISLSVADGTPYGTKLVAWIDGFGLCYNIDAAAGDCSLSIETEATQDVDPYETHRLLLHVGGRSYCLAELRFDASDPAVLNLYGVPYDLVIMDSDLVDLEPAGADWEAIAPMKKDGEIVFDTLHAGILTGFDAAKGTVDVLTVETARIDDSFGVELRPETIADEPVTLTVPESAVLAVYGDEYELLITRERFFTLLEQNYIGFLPTEGEDYFVGCYLGSDNGTLQYLCEMNIG